MNDRRPKVVLYSHDTMGLGHMRRNVLIARALAQSPLAAITLMIAGAPEAVEVCRSAGVSCVALPPLAKDANGAYASRTLDVTLQDLVTLRGHTIRAALEAFDPDVMIVDNVPRGALRELDDALLYLRRRGRSRCVLGLRDVLDEAHTVRREWHIARNVEAIREFFDEIWVYGDPAVYDPVRQYGFPATIANRTRHVGYLDPRARLDPARDAFEELAARLDLPAGRLAVCVVGGGQDGGALAAAFAGAERPPDMNAVIVTGPYMPEPVRTALQRTASEHSRLRVVEYLAEPLWLLRRADRIVTMGGYNSVCEVLSLGTPALIVPRIIPRREQAIRAERLQALGLVDVLPAETLCSGGIAEWLARDCPSPSDRHMVDLDGLTRLTDRTDRLLRTGVAVSGRRAAAMGAGYGT
jgi:predicted glycosyltransferase